MNDTTAAFLKMVRNRIVVCNYKGDDIGTLTLEELCQVISIASHIPIIAPVKPEPRVKKIAIEIKAAMTPGVG